MKQILLTISAVFIACSLQAQTNTAKPSGGKLPPARQIFDRFVKEMGGRETMMKYSSHHSKGTFEMAAQGLKGQLEIFAAKPNKFLMNIDIPGFGKVQNGYDGKTAWSLDPAQGPMVMKDKQLAQMQEQADFYAPLHEEKDLKSAETLEQTTFKGKDAYRVKVVRKSGNENMEYFDVNTGMMIGMTSSQETPFGPMTVTMSIEEYKEFGGIKTPSKVSMVTGPVSQTLAISSVEYNKVKPEVFELPAQIKSLASGGAAPAKAKE